MWRMGYIKTRAGDILRLGQEELHTLDDLTYQKHKKKKFIKLQMSVSGTQQLRPITPKEHFVTQTDLSSGNALPHLLPDVLELKDG